MSRRLQALPVCLGVMADVHGSCPALYAGLADLERKDRTGSVVDWAIDIGATLAGRDDEPATDAGPHGGQVVGP